MPNTPSAARDTLSFRIGRWVEASATGWGLVVLAVLAILLALVVLARWPVLLAH